MMETDYSKLSRVIQSLPDHIRSALEHAGLADDFYTRPAYQQNDYLAWIERAKRPETKEKRLLQMMRELEAGGIYMNMEHKASVKKPGRQP